MLLQMIGFPSFLWLNGGCLVAKSSQDSFVIPWTVAHQVLLSMGFSRQEYWSGLSFPSPGHLLDSGMEPISPAWQVDSLPLSNLGSFSQ